MVATDWPETAEKKLISVPNLSQVWEGLPDVTQKPFVNQKDWRRGSTDDLRVAKPLQFSRKKGLLLVSNPFCLYLLEWLRGLDLNQRPSGYENGVIHLGSLILRDLAPRPVPRLLSQICPNPYCTLIAPRCWSDSSLHLWMALR